MKNKGMLIGANIVASLMVVFGVTISAAKDHAKDQDRYTLKVPGGLAFSEFKRIRKLAGDCRQPAWRNDRCNRRKP